MNRPWVPNGQPLDLTNPPSEWTAVTPAPYIDKLYQLVTVAGDCAAKTNAAMVELDRFMFLLRGLEGFRERTDIGGENAPE